MKAITHIAAALLVVTVGFVSTSNINKLMDNSADDVLLSCLWITYCGEPDIYSPVPQPKDKTIDTQGKDKDSKTA